ncbi:MAG: serine/threonine-protein kinase, partial [Pseudomonadota bacterium]
MSDTRAGAIFQVGDLLNNTYRIEAVLGRGGTSEVYQARSEISGHRVALKALRSEFSDNEDFLNLMTREEGIREIRHDAIVRYYHNQRTADGVVFLIMDYVEGPGLERKMKEGGMAAAELLVVAERVAEGLKAAHDKNIVHRDLSPDNIILRGGAPSDAVIIDFGIAKDSNPGAETVVGNEFAGKYAYAAPEQLSGSADARSDIYALGALLLATFRGASPSVGRNPLEVIEGKSAPLDTSGVPEPLKGIIDRMTAVDPAARFQSAGALLSAIRGGETPEAEIGGPDSDDATVVAPLAPKAPGKGADPSRKAGKRSVLLPLVAVLAIAGVGAGAYFSGLLDQVISPLPVADPYTLVVEQPADGPPMAAGYVPDGTIQTALNDLMELKGGTADLSLARGDIEAEWAGEVLALLEVLAPLPEWRAEVTGNSIAVSGMTEDRTEQQLLNGLD